MVNYRRARIAGATYFFTVTLRGRRSGLLTARVDLLRAVFRSVRHQRPFAIEAMVVLPDHLHTVWRLSPADADFRGVGGQLSPASPERWYTRAFRSFAIIGANTISGSGASGNMSSAIDSDFARHVDYIHHNLVKHGLVANSSDWPWSSIHYYVRRGLIPPDWGGHAWDGRFDDR